MGQILCVKKVPFRKSGHICCTAINTAFITCNDKTGLNVTLVWAWQVLLSWVWKDKHRHLYNYTSHTSDSQGRNDIVDDTSKKHALIFYQQYGHFGPHN